MLTEPTGKSKVDYSYYQRIVRLITGSIGEILAEEEKTELEAWLKESPANQALYDRICNLPNYRTWKEERERIDVREGWEHLRLAIRREEKRVLRLRLMRYAAMFLLPILAIGGILYFLSQRESSTLVAGQATEIRPGERKAVLVLNDGKSIVLDSPDSLVLREKDGTVIQKGAGQLNYSPSSPKATQFPIFNTIRIPRGGEYHLVLSDGSHVYLNSESQFTYPVHFSETAREVELSGEAYFEVEKAGIPFIVHTKDMGIEVLGTSFNINAYDNTGEIVATLVEGSIKVDARDRMAGSRVLYPDEQAVLNMARRSIEVKKVDVNLYTAWRKGELIFFDMRLEDIMTILTRWYSADVFYMNPSVKELRFSGCLNRYENINQILDIIASTEKVAIEINKTTILFSER